METLSSSASPELPRVVRQRAALRILARAAAATLAAIVAGRLVAPHLTVNVTSSMPCGLYWLRPAAPIERGTIVTFARPPGIRSLVTARRYLPPDFHLLKRVVALAGDPVCLDGDRYVAAGQLVSPIATHDHLGRRLQPYPFCGVVPDGAVFVAAHGDSSLDSRYFGPIPVAALTPAVPLWTSSSF